MGKYQRGEKGEYVCSKENGMLTTPEGPHTKSERRKETAEIASQPVLWQQRTNKKKKKKKNKLMKKANPKKKNAPL